MNRDYLHSIIGLFAFTCLGEGEQKVQEAQHLIERKFLNDIISPKEKKHFLEFLPIVILGLEEKLSNKITELELIGLLCTEVNQQHLQKDKASILFYLVELHKSSLEKKENQIRDIAENLKIHSATVELIFKFLKATDAHNLNSSLFLVVNGDLNYSLTEQQHYKKDLEGEILVLKVPTLSYLFCRNFCDKIIVTKNEIIEPGGSFILNNGDSCSIEKVKIYFSALIRDFINRHTEHRYSLAAENLNFKIGKNQQILRDINVCEETGTLVGIMGASGAGKTSLLNLLTGLEKPSNGEVRINGTSIHTNAKHFEGVIGYISQDDILFEDLTVFQNLYYNAQLIFKNYSKSQIGKLVLKTLSNLGLAEIKDFKVGTVLNKKISGGQRKRLNIALELIREPAILFVDEPTSGLSSKDSENVMELLKNLCAKGKLIFVVIHQPSGEVYKLFDKILILDTGGYQVYYGNPLKAPSFFKKAADYVNSDSAKWENFENINPEIIFNILEEKQINDDGELSNDRKTSPLKWNTYFKEKIKVSFRKEIKEKANQVFELPNKLKQFFVFCKRDLFSKLSNKQYLFLNLLEAPVLAGVLAFIIRYTAKLGSTEYVFRENENLPAYIFMAVIVVMFLGLSVSSEEIYKDRKIMKREKFLHLSRFSYLTSKLGILFTLSAIQTALFVLVGNGIMGVKGMFFPYFITLFSISCASNVLGLVISSTFNSVVTIYIIIPLLIIPQMILGGAMFSYDKLNQAVGGGAKVPLIADFTGSRWAYEGIAVYQFTHNNFDKNFYEIDKKISALNFKITYSLPQLSQFAQDAKLLINKQDDSLKTLLEDKLEVLRNEIKKEIALDSTLEFKSLHRMYRGMFTKYVSNATIDFFDKLVKKYTNKFLGADKEKNDLITSFLEDEKKYQRIKDNFSNDYLGDVVKHSLSKNKTIVENGELKQLIDAVYLDTDRAFISFDTHFFAPKKYLFNKPIHTLYFNVFIIWLFSLISFIFLYFNLLKKLLAAFTIKVSLKK